jgi:hypothetical protein
MNWLWVTIVTVALAGVMEWVRRRKNRAGLFLAERLKTLSARITVSFLLAFAAHIPFAQAEIGALQRGMLVLVALALVGANLIRLDGREA